MFFFLMSFLNLFVSTLRTFNLEVFPNTHMFVTESADFTTADNMAGGKKKSSTLPSKIQKALSSIWQDKHMVLFKAEYTFLVTAVLWFLEVGINIWVIQKVACKCSNVESISDMILGEVNNRLKKLHTA